MPGTTVKVEGLRELQRAAKLAGKDCAREVTAAFKEAAAPVQASAQTRAVGIGAGSRWSRMRTGATTLKVYVAPASRRRGGSPRPQFGTRLLKRAMIPALDENEALLLRRVDEALDRIQHTFER